MSKKYKRFKPGDKVIVKTMDEIKRDFTLYPTDDGDEHYLSPLKDVYFTGTNKPLCGKQVTIKCRLSEDMSEDYHDYEYWSNLYFIEENPLTEDREGHCIDTWSVTMFREEHADQ